MSLIFPTHRLVLNLSCWPNSNNSSKGNGVKSPNDNMDFNSDSITPDFDADDINIFEELSSSNSFSQQPKMNPLERILLEEEEVNESITFDSDVIADLLQVLAHHAIVKHSDDPANVLPDVANDVDINSARVTSQEDEFRLSLLVELQDEQKIRPCVRVRQENGSLNIVEEEEKVPKQWLPLYKMLHQALSSAIDSLKATAQIA
jgi:hypothetical protein